MDTLARLALILVAFSAIAAKKDPYLEKEIPILLPAGFKEKEAPRSFLDISRPAVAD